MQAITNPKTKYEYSKSVKKVKYPVNPTATNEKTIVLQRCFRRA